MTPFTSLADDDPRKNVSPSRAMESMYGANRRTVTPIIIIFVGVKFAILGAIGDEEKLLRM